MTSRARNFIHWFGVAIYITALSAIGYVVISLPPN